MKAKITFILSLLMGFTMLSPVVSAEEQAEGTVDNFSANISEQIDLDVDAAVAIDQETGQLLFKHNDDQLHGIASITKLISLFVVYDEIDEGNISLDTKVPISEEVAELSREAELSNVPLDVSSDRYTVNELIDASVISSANAAIVALAELIAGSEQSFVSMMKDKLTELGINDYEIYTASGLSGEMLTGNNTLTADYENKMQARDILFVAHQLIEEYPEIIERTQITSKTFKVSDTQAVNMINTNMFLPGQAYERNDIFGLKTGSEDLAGACIIVLSYIGDRPVLLVTLGADNNDARFVQTGNLLDSLQKNLQWTTLATENETWLGEDTINVYQGRPEQTSFAFNDTNQLFLPVNYNHSLIQNNYEEAWQYDAAGNIVIDAPLDVGEVVNQFNIQVPFVETLFNKITLNNAFIATEEVNRVNPVIQIARIMADMFSDWTKQLSKAFANL